MFAHIKFSHIKAIIWDLDNTITNSADAHFKAWDMTLKRHNIPHSRAFFDAHYGMNNRDIFENSFSDYVRPEEIEGISDEKEFAFREIIQKEPIEILPGVEAWMKYFKERGLVQGLASSGPMINIVAQIQSIGLGDYFLVITTGSPLINSKPHPQVFLNAAAGLNIAPEHCLVIEDTLHGIEAAMRAKMQCVLVRNEDERERAIIAELADTHAQSDKQYVCVQSLADIHANEVLN